MMIEACEDEYAPPSGDGEFERIVKAEVRAWMDSHRQEILDHLSRRISFSDLVALSRVN
jgi:hypothetical protein